MQTHTHTHTYGKKKQSIARESHAAIVLVALKLYQTHTRARAHTRMVARQTGTTQVPSIRILVSWIVKQDRACPTPIGAFLQHR